MHPLNTGGRRTLCGATPKQLWPRDIMRFVDKQTQKHKNRISDLYVFPILWIFRKRALKTFFLIDQACSLLFSRS